MTRPYDQTFIYDRYVRPETAFFAVLPAFMAIGRRMYAVWRAHKRAGDLTRPWRELVAEQSQAPLETPRVGESDNRTGRYRIECCGCKEANPAQKRLFDWLEANQTAVVEAIKPGICQLFDDTVRWRSSPDPGDQILFPVDAADEEKLDRFEVKYFKLDPQGRDLWIELETLDAWYEGHGCCVVVRDGKLWSAGSWDRVEAADESDGPDFEYFA